MRSRAPAQTQSNDNNYLYYLQMFSGYNQILTISWSLSELKVLFVFGESVFVSNFIVSLQYLHAEVSILPILPILPISLLYNNKIIKFRFPTTWILDNFEVKQCKVLNKIQLVCMNYRILSDLLLALVNH